MIIVVTIEGIARQSKDIDFIFELSKQYSRVAICIILYCKELICFVGPVNSASWSNQGPQQWDQSSSVDSQSGHFPHSTVPQDQYTQMNQQGQFQNGKVLYVI